MLIALSFFGCSSDDSTDSALEYWCAERYQECGGTADLPTQLCVDLNLTNYGECESRRTLVEAYFDCHIQISCDEYDADFFIPSSLECADLHQELE